jgi:MFS transporter, DHA2 family, multidrug resistance protein
MPAIGVSYSLCRLGDHRRVLDTSIANVALQHIAGSMAASIDESTWVLTSHLWRAR